MNQIIPFVVLALNHPSGEKFERALLKREGFAFKPVRGCYQGSPEPAYIIPVGSYADIVKIASLAKRWHQESVLHVSQTGEAVLIYTDGRAPDYMGRWQEVPEGVAKALDGFTFDPATQHYYAARR